MKNRTLYTLLLSFLSLSLWAQPTANFTVDVTEGCSPLTVNFANASTGNALTYSWDFDDGNQSTVENPTHEFITTGSYTICLTVTDDLNATDEFCIENLITVFGETINNYEATICEGDSIVVFGNTYTIDNPTGSEVLPNGNSNGCDSTVNVNITFYSAAVGSLNSTLCASQVIVVNGVVFDEDNPAGEVLLQGSSFNGCDSIVVVNLNFYPEASSIITSTLCFGQTLEVNGTVYSVANPSATDTIPGGSYTGCDSTIHVDLTFNPLVETLIEELLCVGESMLLGDNVYDENNPSGTELLMDIYGCDSILVVDLTFLPADEVSIVSSTVSAISCFGAADGSICVDEIVCSQGTYIYEWSNGQNDMVCIENLDAGSYTVTVTNTGSGNTAVENYVIEESAIPLEITVVAVNDVTCYNGFNGSIEFGVTGGWGGYTYSSPLNNLTPGTYSITVTDINGCSDVTPDITISEPDSLMLFDAAITTVGCGVDDGAINLSIIGGTSPYTYLWSNGMNTAEVTGLSVGGYSVTVTDMNNCVLIVPPIVVSGASSMTATPSVTDASCSGDLGCIDMSSVVGGTPPFTYLWNDGSTDVVNCNLAGAYSVTIVDGQSCQFVSNNIVISEPTELQLFLAPSCATVGQGNGSIVLSVFGGVAPYQYEWSNGFTTQNITNLSAGTYAVTITDNNGCTAVEETNTNNLIEWMTGDTLICSVGGETPLFVTAPSAVSYNWEPAALLNDPTSSSPNANLTVTTTFSVTVTTAAGCEEVGQVIVNVLDNSGVLLETTNATCGVNNGSIYTSFPCGGNAPYSFEWNTTPIQTGAIATNLAAGVYEVTVTDNIGQTNVGSTEVFDVSDLVVDISSPTTFCEGGELLLCVAPMTGVSYLWTGPNGFISTQACPSIPNIDETFEGCYTLVVTDGNGCTGEATACIEVLLASEIVTSISPEVSICTGETTLLEVFTNGPLAQYTFNWSPAISLDNVNIPNPIAAPIDTTDYQVQVVDASSGCMATAEVRVAVVPDCVWPGDTDTNKIVNNFDLLNIGLAYDSIGPLRPNANLMWNGQAAPDWMYTVSNGSNFKHIDCDGNGWINSDDTLAITQNWGEIHNFTGSPVQQFVSDYPTSNGAPLTIPFYVQPDTLIEGNDMVLPIVLGEMDNIAENIYGLAFSLEYDTAFFVSGSVAIDFSDSWLGETNNNMITIQRDFFSDGRVDIAMTRIDGTEMTDFGQLAQLFITVEDDILFAPGGGGNGVESIFFDQAIFNISNVLVLNNDGEEIPVIPMETTAEISPITDVNDISLEEAIHIYPNPAKDRIWVTTKNIKLEKLLLFDLNGKVLRSGNGSSLELEGLVDGLYLLKVQTEAGVYVERLIKN